MVAIGPCLSKSKTRLGPKPSRLTEAEAPALDFLAKTKVDLGVLDVHLEGAETSFEIARKLADADTPFLFASGYGATTDLPERLGPRPVVLKPVSKRELSARIDELFDVGRSG